jgi:hypothetical protein
VAVALYLLLWPSLEGRAAQDEPAGVPSNLSFPTQGFMPQTATGRVDSGASGNANHSDLRAYPPYNGSDLDCAELGAPVSVVRGYDPYFLDLDGNGIGCESSR